MSVLTYNGVSLQLMHTSAIARDNIRSPDGSDRYYTRWTFEVEAVYNPGATSYGPDGTPNPGVLPCLTDAAIREKLSEPRASLTYDVGGAILIQSPTPPATVDALNGPQPLGPPTIRAIHGQKTFLVHFKIETFVSECTTPAEAAEDPLLSNRFEVTHAINDQRMTTLSYSGVAAFRMDALGLTATGAADAYRARCLPPIPIGFQRKQIVCRVNSIGNMLMWQCVDQEMFYSLGAFNRGVERFEAVYTQSSTPAANTGDPSNHDAASLDIRVWGNKNSQKFSLILFCMAIATERLGLKARPAVNDDPLIKQVSITEVMHDRIVDLRIMVILPAAKNGIAAAPAINANRLGFDLLATLANDGLNPQMPNDGNTRGTYTGQAFAQALQAACTRVEQVKLDPGQSNGDKSYPIQSYTPQVTTSVSSSPSLGTTRYADPTTSSGLITDYRVKARWQRKSGRVQVPTAGRSDGRPSRPVIFKLHSPVTSVRYDWVVERNGSKPMVPDPNHSDQRMVLLDSVISVNEKYLGTDGVTPVYRVAGEYSYAWDEDDDVPKPIAFPVVPWTDYKFGDDYLTGDDEAHGIIDSPDSTSADPSSPTPTYPAGPTEPTPTEPPTQPTTTTPPAGDSPHDGEPPVGYPSGTTTG